MSLAEATSETSDSMMKRFREAIAQKSARSSPANDPVADSEWDESEVKTPYTELMAGGVLKTHDNIKIAFTGKEAYGHLCSLIIDDCPARRTAELELIRLLKESGAMPYGPDSRIWSTPAMFGSYSVLRSRWLDRWSGLTQMIHPGSGGRLSIAITMAEYQYAAREHVGCGETIVLLSAQDKNLLVRYLANAVARDIADSSATDLCNRAAEEAYDGLPTKEGVVRDSFVSTMRATLAGDSSIDLETGELMSGPAWVDKMDSSLPIDGVEADAKELECVIKAKREKDASLTEWRSTWQTCLQKDADRLAFVQATLDAAWAEANKMIGHKHDYASEQAFVSEYVTSRGITLEEASSNKLSGNRLPAPDGEFEHMVEARLMGEDPDSDDVILGKRDDPDEKLPPRRRQSRASKVHCLVGNRALASGLTRSGEPNVDPLERIVMEETLERAGELVDESPTVPPLVEVQLPADGRVSFADVTGQLLAIVLPAGWQLCRQQWGKLLGLPKFADESPATDARGDILLEPDDVIYILDSIGSSFEVLAVKKRVLGLGPKIEPLAGDERAAALKVARFVTYGITCPQVVADQVTRQEST